MTWSWAPGTCSPSPHRTQALLGCLLLLDKGRRDALNKVLSEQAAPGAAEGCPRVISHAGAPGSVKALSCWLFHQVQSIMDAWAVRQPLSLGCGHLQSPAEGVPYHILMTYHTVS